jgi:hypothetical protein
MAAPRISYFAELATPTRAALLKERRMKLIDNHGSRQEIRVPGFPTSRS